MVNKNHEIKTKRNNYSSIMFNGVVAIYIGGLLRGGLFALKNSENLDFITKITFTQNMVKNENITFFAAYIGMFLRDIIAVCLLPVFKYSGIQRGLCICVPFVTAFQNACVYIVSYSGGATLLNLLINYTVKDTAVCFLVLLFCYVIAVDIIADRYNVKRDISKLTVYLTGIIVIYMIDFILKAMI